MNRSVERRAQNLTDGADKNAEEEKDGPKNHRQDDSPEHQLPILALALTADKKTGKECDATKCPADTFEE